MKNLFLIPKIMASVLTAMVLLFYLTACNFLSSEGSFETGPAGQGQENGEIPGSEKGQLMVQEEETREIIIAKAWIEDPVPESLAKEIISVLAEDRGDDIQVDLVDNFEEADVKIEIDSISGPENFLWVLAPVVSFFSTFDDISSQDLKKFWTGDDSVLGYIGVEDQAPLLDLSEETYRVLEKIWGPGLSTNIQIVEAAGVRAGITEVPGSFSIVPFGHIEKEYKVLYLDGVSVLDKDLEPGDYPLAFGIKITGKDIELVDIVKNRLEPASFTNRDVEKLAAINMTGVTALARGKNIGARMDEFGILYPAEQIAGILRDADITHISNEIPFVEGCSQENRFPLLCSLPAYFALLEYVGTDVIELTGNHLNDYGLDWLLYTLDIYDEEGLPYFGGGRDLEQSYEPVIFEIGGYKYAFLGRNAFGKNGLYEWATGDTPGAAPLNIWEEEKREEDFKKLEEIIGALKKDGHIVIFTFQYQETERYSPTESQVTDFRRVIDIGADIVSGSQAHQPMGVEFWEDGFINYGLGNLFFNMRSLLGLKQGIIARHLFYDGKHINTVLITTMLEDLSQPRLTTPEERIELLDSIFAGSIK